MKSWRKTLRMKTTLMIPPAHLDHSWRSFVSKKLGESFLHSCIPHFGFITSITHPPKDSENIQEEDLNITSTSGEVKYTVEFIAQAFIPKPGICMEARTELITPHGVLLQHPYMNIFLPERYLKRQGYSLKTTFSSTIFFSPVSTISSGMKITVVLVHVRFENNRFFSLARLANNE